MDIEFELLKRMKAENGEDFFDTPTRLSSDELDEALKTIVQNYSFLHDGSEHTLEEEIEIIKENMYVILDTLVRMGVHPGFIIAALTNYNFEKLKNKDRIIYNNGRKKSSGVLFPYADVRRELRLMNNFNYQGYRTDLSHCYDDILLMDKTLSLPYSTEPKKLDLSRKQAIYISITNQRNQIANADDIIDESIYIVDLLYTSVCMLVEMGINPYKILINKILEESEKGKLR